MSPRLGLRSRILALTMPVVLVVSAAIATLLYFSLGQILEASARDAAAAEALELRADLQMHTVQDLTVAHEIGAGTRVSQVVDECGVGRREQRRAAHRAGGGPGGGTGRSAGRCRRQLPGVGRGGYAVAVADSPGLDGRRYSAVVAVPTRVETTALGRSLELATIGAIGLVVLLAAVTTFAVGQALRPVERMRNQVEGIAPRGRRRASRCRPGVTSSSRLAETMDACSSASGEPTRRGGRSSRTPGTSCAARCDDPRVAGHARRGPVRGRAARHRRACLGGDDRLSVLVQDLLELASADEGAMRLERVEVDLDDVVLAEAASLRARGMPVAVTVEPMRVVGDPHRLGRVVRNLLENAERHRENEVRLTLDQDAGDALILVDNDGPPVAPEERERIFWRFVRLDDSRTRDTGGTGLGLAIVAEIVRAHGGTVRAEVAPDGWCRFSVRLPLGRNRVEPVAHAAHGLEGLGRERRVDLAAEVADVDLDDVVGAGVVGVPDVLEDLALALHLARASHQVVQEGVLPGGQLDLPATAGDSPRGGVEREAADGQGDRSLREPLDEPAPGAWRAGPAC